MKAHAPVCARCNRLAVGGGQRLLRCWQCTAGDNDRRGSPPVRPHRPILASSWEQGFGGGSEQTGACR